MTKDHIPSAFRTSRAERHPLKLLELGFSDVDPITLVRIPFFMTNKACPSVKVTVRKV